MEFEAKRRKKKPLNQERRMKQLMEKKPKKERGEPIPSGGYWDEGRKKPKQKRQDTKKNLKRYIGSECQEIASSLSRLAKLIAASSTSLQ